MNAAEAMAALNTVEQDHRMVLEKMQALKDCVNCLLRPGELDAHRVLGRFRDINDYLATNFTAHLLEEEKTLLPFLEQQKPDGAELVGRLRLEHEEIRYKREEFGNCLQVALDLENNLPRAVTRDLLIDGWALWELLDKHAYVETQAVQECIARHLRSES